VLAWGAEYLLSNEVTNFGALGPIEAFGLDNLIAGCKQAGLELTQVNLPVSFPNAKDQASIH